ncbi:hypothetical protein Dimus_037942 [Dionaea muscipula]
MSPPSTTEEVRLEDAREEAIKSLDSLEEAPRRHMFRRIINWIKSSKSEIREPSYHTSHKGRPSSKEERSGARIKSFLEHATSMRSGSKSMGTKSFRSQSIGSASTVEGTNNDDVFRSLLPAAYQHNIKCIVDVQADGNCRFRAVAAHVFDDETHWYQVRMDLIRWINNNRALYTTMWRVDRAATEETLARLNCDTSLAPSQKWMDMTTMGLTIASNYNVVLHCFTSNHRTSYTYLPLLCEPVPDDRRREIVIVWVNNCHFVQMFMHSN